MLRDLIINFAIIIVFVFLVEQVYRRAELNKKANYLEKIYVGLIYGGLSIILLNFSIDIDEYTKLNYRGIAYLLAAYFGGPVASVVVACLTYTARFVMDGKLDEQQVLIGFTAALGTGVVFTKFRSYWMKWISGTLCLILVYYGALSLINKANIENIWSYMMLQAVGAIFIALFLRYLLKTNKYKQMVKQMENEMLDMLQMQPGFTLKFHKHRGKYVYVLIEGELLNRLGLRPDMFIGKAVDEVEAFPPAFREIIKKQYDRAWSGERTQYETEFSHHYLFVTLQPMFEFGVVTDVIGCAVDVTSHKSATRRIRESEELYRTLVENSQDFILGLDEEGAVTSVNRTLCRFVSLPQEQVIGKRLAEVVGMGDAGLWEQHLYECMTNGQSQKFELTLFGTDNNEYHYNMTLSPIIGIESSVTKIVVTMHDITDVKKRKEAVEASQAKSQFLARMSHEIRTPLNGIIGLSLLLKKTELSNVQKDYMDKINSSSQALLGMINDVLDFSKIEAGKLGLEKISFGLEALFCRLADTISISIGSKRLHVMFETDPDLPLTVIGDPYRLEQVLLNLLSNAVKFTEAGHVIFRVSLDGLEVNEAVISFSVEDTGIGLSQEQITHLFASFTQADISMSRKYGGTGLGLVISKSLVETMGGQLQVESTESIGSRFFFSLPMELPELEISPQLVAGGERVHPVITVVNNSLMRDSLRNMLQSYRLQTDLSSYSYDDLLEVRRKVQSEASEEAILLIVDIDWDTWSNQESWIPFIHALNRDKVKIISLTKIMDRDGIPYASDYVITKPICRSRLYETVDLVLEPGDPVPAEQESEERSQGDRGRILVAEDNEINQLVVQGLLQRRGFSVTFANNGAEVLSQLNNNRWDAVLMDLHMPKLDGFQATKKIRQNKQYDRIPIIALTANVMKQDHEQCMAAGMNDILTKPVDDERLIETLDKWIQFQGLASIQGIDTEKAIRQMAGKPHILQYALTKFCHEYETFQVKLEEEMRQEKAIEAKRRVHSLKGVAANLYAGLLLKNVISLEQAVHEGDPGWVGRLVQVQAEIDKIVRSVFWK